jgi:predicted Rossmann fold flavoprotein
MDHDVIIIGAGAAGLYCAAHAGRRGKRVLLVEHNREIGAKILISGGGRCNFTNREIKPERFLSANPHFAKSALARHTQHDFIALVQRHNIAFYEKTLGQLFGEGAGAAKQIVAMLAAECRDAKVDLRTGLMVGEITRSDRFAIATPVGRFSAPNLVIATGGLSIPKLGATDFGYRIATQFGVPLIAPRPGLVPLTFAPADRETLAALSGVAVDAIARCGKATFREGLLFTHRGLSGPSILQISSYWAPGAEIAIDLAPDAATSDAGLAALKRARPKITLRTAMAALFPDRLADALLANEPAAAARLTDLKDADLANVAARFRSWRFTPAGDEGYAKAEVTLGGVDTAALSSQTMMAKAVPGLFFIGEAVDVTGWLGGYNFQWAWSSAWAAAQAV